MKSNQDMHIVTRAIMRHGTNIQKESVSLGLLLKGVYIFGQGLKACDPRDFIFGLLNMSADSANLGIFADYSKSKHEPFVQVATAFIKQRGLELFTWSNSQELSKAKPFLPSWAPDWSAPIIKPLADFGRKSDFRFKTSGDSQPQFNFIGNSDGDPIVVATGIVVDIVLAVGDSIMNFPVSDISWYDNDQDPNFNLALQWLDDIQTLSKHCGNIYGGLPGVKDAIWRTPIGDLEFTPEGKHQRASKSLEKCYQLCRSGILRAVVKSTELQQRKDDFTFAARYWKLMATRCSNRRLFTSRRGYLGLGPAVILVGDIIAVILGLDTPLVLRRAGSDSYRIVGEAYVHGIMDGEAMKGSPSTQAFNIC
jgi:hypothetical protein